jgi:hypothetical protein
VLFSRSRLTPPASTVRFNSNVRPRNSSSAQLQRRSVGLPVDSSLQTDAPCAQTSSYGYQNFSPTRIMNRRTFIIASAVAMSACATQAPSEKPDAQSLLGTWIVDLRPSPDAPAYLKTFIVSAVSEGSFQGSFYDTPISEGRVNVEWGTIRIAFVTADGSGPYNHSAVLAGRKLEGLTNSTGRKFLSYWSASKQ